MESLSVGLCHNKPKKPAATAIVPKDYICTQGDLALIDFIKEIPCEPRVEVVLIDDAFIERKSMECLFQPNAYIGDEVFIPINIRETHWYLVVIHAINMEIQVLDSLGTSQDRKDLTDSIKGLQRQIDMISQRKELKDHRWPDLQVASWPLREIDMGYAKQTDSSSCGLFLLNYIEYWTGYELSDSFTQDDMSHFRKKMAAILLSSDLNKRRGCLLYKNDKEVDSGSPSDVEILENPTDSKKRKLLHVLHDSEVVYEDEEGPITQADLQKWFVDDWDKRAPVKVSNDGCTNDFLMVGLSTKDMPVTKADSIDVLCDYIMAIEDDTTLEYVLMPWKFNGCHALFVIDHVKKHVTFIDFTPTQDWCKHMPYKRFAEAIIMASKKYKIAYSKKRSGWAKDIFKWEHTIQTEDALRRALAARKAAVDAQAEAVRALKAGGGASKADVDAAVEALKALKVEAGAAARRLQQAVGAGAGGAAREELRQAVVNTLERKLFYIPSFKIYRGVAGLYDYGPPGCRVKANVLSFWRQHFVLEENMLEVDCPCVTPEVVLKASGHVEKFTDLMVKDEKTGTCYRADHLLKDFCKEKLEKDLALPQEKADEFKRILAILDDLSAEELGAKIKEYGIVAPDTKNPLSDPYPFNLMFQTSIGPTGLSVGYMRPETAQGIFVNFKDLYYYNGQKLPFAAAQIGQAFRNEISPRQGLLRVREFTLAEIEHFVDPEDKSHPKFVDVADLEFLMFPRELQLSGESAKLMKLGEAVSKGTVNNETLGYFIGRVYLFLTSLGIDKGRLRFRQHLPNEMAHYAADCWDAEIECSYGWIECVGIADRSAYDLKAHTDKSGVPLVAHEKFSKPREVEKLVIVPSKKDLGLAFKGNQKMVLEALEAMSEKEAFEMKAELETKGETNFKVCTLGKDVVITKKMVSISMEKKLEHQRVFTPSVVEPSFGIGRIIYCLFEHSFYTRPSKSEEEQLNVFRFPPLVAPIKCTVFPLVKNQEFDDAAKVIAKALTTAGISHIIDTTAISIGRRYARTDEIGVPFAVTVDSATNVTIRERDSKEQVRVDIDEVAPVVKQLTEGQSTWTDVSAKYPAHVGPQSEQE
ncbi:Glycine--tRNA ligase, mitochondrial 1 [Zea mays]|uniref:glycine--tRNA ligase n=2 Tax=Zea mays TaxID=4577 RepID=A0A3L6EZC3_MAIZE|nr:Glycine--tRNA ligase, mitochondrial 1 [Zea mays]